MKKALSLLLCLVMVLSLTACGNSSTEVTQTTSETAKTTQETQKTDPTEEPTPEPTAEPKPITEVELTSGGVRIWKNSIGSYWQQAIVEIENTGETNIYFNDASYDVEDDAGNMIETEKYVTIYPQIIAPGEKAYLYHETTSDHEHEGYYTILPYIEYAQASVDLVRYPISDVTFNPGDYETINIKGRVENNTDAEITYTYVVALLFDETDNMIGHTFTILTEKIAPGTKMGFEMQDFSMPDDIEFDDIVRCEIYAYPNQYQFSF